MANQVHYAFYFYQIHSFIIKNYKKQDNHSTQRHKITVVHPPGLHPKISAILHFFIFLHQVYRTMRITVRKYEVEQVSLSSTTCDLNLDYNVSLCLKN